MLLLFNLLQKQKAFSKTCVKWGNILQAIWLKNELNKEETAYYIFSFFISIQ